MAMLSMPVCGVESRNDVAAARLAPWRRKEADDRNHSAGAQHQRHAKQRRLQDRPKASAAQVTLDELRRDTDREHARRQKAKQQVRRHLAEHQPAFPRDFRDIGQKSCYPSIEF